MIENVMLFEMFKKKNNLILCIIFQVNDKK